LNAVVMPATPALTSVHVIVPLDGGQRAHGNKAVLRQVLVLSN